PAQRVVVRWCDIYGSAVAQAIRPDITVALYLGSCENRKRQQKPEKCDACGYSHAPCLTAATTARETLADLQVFSLNGLASAGSPVRGTAMRLADIPSRSARFGSNARGPKSQNPAQLWSAFEAIAGFRAMHASLVPPVEIAWAIYRIRDETHATKPRVACPPRRPNG